jgi:hypothetical protein
VSIRSLKNNSIRQKKCSVRNISSVDKKNVFWEIRPVGTFDWFIRQVLQISRTQAFNYPSKNLKNISSRQKKCSVRNISSVDKKNVFWEIRPVGTFDWFIRQILQIQEHKHLITLLKILRILVHDKKMFR